MSVFVCAIEKEKFKWLLETIKDVFLHEISWKLKFTIKKKYIYSNSLPTLELKDVVTAF